MGLNNSKRSIVLTIAGFDPTAGAGIIADIKTFAAFNCYGIAVTTAVTVQDTTKVYTSSPVDAGLVKEQLKALSQDFSIDSVKIGMLANEEIISVVIDFLLLQAPKFVIVDPLLYSTSGYPLLNLSAKKLVIEKLFPLATLITPNLKEASLLLEEDVKNLEDMKQAANKLQNLAVSSILIKGGHLEEDAIDLFYDGLDYKVFSGTRISKSAHGTGCSLSSAIAASLACGNDLIRSIEIAKQFITKALETAEKLGKGDNLLNHFWNTQNICNQF